MKRRRLFAWALLVVMSMDIIAPTTVMGLTSGPSQPEVQGFTPIGASDMVNLFSGDMSYNIPLLDVEGYPINLSYNAGVGMDQEASWVGLGWSLNPGIVERHMRGLPDDFCGDLVKRETSLRPNITVGATVGYNFELWGVQGDAISGNLTASVNPSYNNYDGAQFSIGMNMGMRSTISGSSCFTAGLGMTSSSNGGLNLQPQVGVEREYGKSDKKLTAGLNFGLSMSSRQGLSNVSLGTSLKSTRSETNADPKQPGSHVATSWSRNGPGKSFDIGQPTYSPQISVPMENLAVSLRVTLGSDGAGFHPNGFIGGSYSRQRVRNPVMTQPAYGYLHLGSGQNQQRALLDFNREKDGPYSAAHTALPIANITNDIFAVSGQNMGGSYRAYRDEVGHVFDALSVSTGSGGNLGVEVGIGAGAHFGVDLNVNSMTTRSGDWSDINSAGSQLRFKRNHDQILEEHAYFREANEPVVERDASLYNAMGGSAPRRFIMSSQGGYDMRLDATLTGGGLPASLLPPNEKTARDPRGQLFTYLTHREVVGHLGLEDVIDHGFDISDNHMSEVTVTGVDGTRNVYGIPAYNIRQEDVTFAVGSGLGEASIYTPYTDGTDNSTANQQGKDHYYSRSTTPAYAYAFLLSAVLSPDYSDVDGERGPTKNDLGSYTKFTYRLRDPAFPWRTPVNPDGAHKYARLDRGRGAVVDDDKGSYTFGVKELWYLDRITSRNMVAIFSTSDRNDGCGVDENGQPNTGHKQQRLDQIELWERSQLEAFEDGATDAFPIKTVHFKYKVSGELCPLIPNRIGAVGKLTLDKVWFTYGRSNRGVTSPYVFEYSSENPSYDLDRSDRWGNYKVSDGLTNQIFPYSTQDPVAAATEASAWNLTTVKLPSGGVINVTYEADDYAYVQNKRAHRMFKLAGIQRFLFGLPEPDAEDVVLGGTVTLAPALGGRLFFAIPAEYGGLSDGQLETELVNELGGLVYFRFKTHFDFGALDGWDYVSGYAKPTGGVTVINLGGTRYGYIRFDPIDIDESGGEAAMPMYRSALEQARREYSTEVFQPNGMGADDSPVLDMILSAASAITTLFTGLQEFLDGPNGKTKSNLPEFGEVEVGTSWIRLGEPSGHKKGGGHRVKEVTMSDSWEGMVDTGGDPAVPGRSYGQHYSYTLEDGMSSGVAAWEPGMGADENVWRRPAFGVQPGSMGNDERSYQEEPFGESMFPAASVGYSRVVVQDIYPDHPGYSPADVEQAQGTGYVVNEFFTAKDFPTITRMTDLFPKRRRSNYDVLALLGMKTNDHMHTTQGFVVETNDMHGKPYRTLVYGESVAGQDPALVSSVEYVYARDPLNPQALVNEATTISPDGTIGTNTIGRHYEFYADMREFNSKARSGGMAVNTEMVIPPIIIPIMLFNFSMESTIYRSGVFVKKIHRFGLLEKVVKMENGSVVSTENLAYDSETGGVLLTRTNNEFEDPVYQFKFPAYWYYDGMGPAYENIGALTDLTLAAGTAMLTSANNYFVPGDELALWPLPLIPAQAPVKGWVDQVTSSGLHVISATGAAISGDYQAQVIRSGRRNLQATDMATLLLLSDPLAGFSGNLYTNILQASAVEMTDHWRTTCACLEDGTLSSTTNPYRMNVRGIWRLSKENAWLTDRTRSLENRNTNIRRDGVFTSFDPFYELAGGAWAKEPAGWTMVREVTNYGVRGQELENIDALGIASAATFGFGGSLPKSVARNAHYQEIGFDDFEDRDAPFDCADGHFRISGGVGVSRKAYHTGRTSILVDAGTPAVFSTGVSNCPEQACDLVITSTVGGLILSGGTPPYTISPEIIQGAPVIVPVTNGIQVTGTTWQIIVNASDAVGCSLSQTFSH
ncbi:MAG: hypothetical protein ABI432_11295 [Flavobacteriales bacterium]